MDKQKMYDNQGRMRTLSLFLEEGYNKDAIFTTKPEDYTYKGKKYISLKKLYLEAEDPTEYLFATEYLLGWPHMVKMRGNKKLAAMFDEWQVESEVRLRALGIKGIIDLSMSDGGSYQASKFVAEGGWVKKGVGRPTNEVKARDDKIKQQLEDEFAQDAARLN